MNSNYLSVKEAAEALGLSPWYVRRLCSLGKLPAKRKRKGWIIPKGLVEGLVRQQLEEDLHAEPNAAMIEYEEHEQERAK